MAKEPSLIIATCSWITRLSLWGLVFLLPLFFLPWTSDALDFNKQALLIALSLVALFAWMLKVLLSGSITVNVSHIVNKIHMAVGAFFVVVAASTVFSNFRYGSFWGWPMVTYESLLSVICLGMVYFLVANEFGEKEISTSFGLLGASALIASLYGLLQLLGIYAIPFVFAKSSSFNTIGSVGGLGFFAAALLPLCILFAAGAQRWWKILFLANIVVAFFLLVTINYQFLWILTVVGSALVLFFCIFKHDVFDSRWMFLPMFFLVVSLFFIVLSPQLRWLPQKAVEVSLSQSANAMIDLQALKASPILGSGPGTFTYDFLRYKGKDFNNNVLWNINFVQGASKALTLLATLGVLGFLAFLALVGVPLFYAGWFLFFGRSRAGGGASNKVIVTTVASFIVLMISALGAFLYDYNIVLEFLAFFSIAALVALLSENFSQGAKTYALKISSLLTLGVTFAFTLIFIFGLGFLMLEGQRYVAELSYLKGQKAFAAGDREKAISSLKSATGNNPGLDLYYNQLAIYSLSNLQSEISKLGSSSVTDADRAQLQTIAADAIGAANNATAVGPKNSENWATRGYVCQNLINLVSDATDCAIKSYDQALVFNPYNPYLYVQEGNVLAVSVANAPPSAEKSNTLALAKDKFNKAIDLKPDYSLAYFQKALLAKAQDNENDMLAALQNAEKYAAGDTDMTLQVGLFYYQEKIWDRAQLNFQRILLAYPTYADVLYYSGLTYDRQGKQDQAVSTFKKLAASNPDNSTVQKILANLNAGKAALDGLVQNPPPAPSSSSSVPPSTTVKPATSATSESTKK